MEGRLLRKRPGEWSDSDHEVDMDAIAQDQYWEPEGGGDAEAQDGDADEQEVDVVEISDTEDHEGVVNASGSAVGPSQSVSGAATSLASSTVTQVYLFSRLANRNAAEVVGLGVRVNGETVGGEGQVYHLWRYS